jgi:hypothetical protein
MTQTLNIKAVAKHLKRSFTFRELEAAVNKGERVQDLVLMVPKGVIHSGSIWTSYGQLLVVTNNHVKRAILQKKPERMFTPEY